MNLRPFPPRLDTCSVIAALISTDAVTEIASDAQERYQKQKSSPPWSEIRRQKEVAIHRTLFICLYQAMADWLKANRVTRRELRKKPTHIGIRRPATILREKAASELDLAFLFAGLAIFLKYHASLIWPENGSVADAMLALATEPDTRSAIDSETLHILTFSPAFKKYPGDSRGSDRYWEASRQNFNKHISYWVTPTEPEDAGQLRFAPYLERAVFNVLTSTGTPNGTGFFVTRDGYALTCRHVLEDHDQRPVYDKDNRFSIRYLNKRYENWARWFPGFSHGQKDVAVVKVMVAREGFPDFNTLPLGNDYHAGLNCCLRGFGEPEGYPLGNFCKAEVSSMEKNVTATINDDRFSHPDDPEAQHPPALKLIKLIDGTFSHGMSGAPVVRMDTGRVFAVQTAWDPDKNWGLCIPVKTFLKLWRGYSPFWPDLAFSLV